MKRIGYLVIAIACILIVGIMLPQQSNSQECRIITILGGATAQTQELILSAPSLVVQKGDCVVWFNRARANEVKVSFENGKTCQNLTDAPFGFKIDDAKDCYVTSWIPFGGTSSLRFVKKGALNYTVETAGGIKTTGKILVQE